MARHAAVTLAPAVRANPEKFRVLKEIGKLDTAKNNSPTYVIEFNDEWGYHGERIDGQKTGEGYENYQDGRKYVGHFKNNKFEGFGAFYDRRKYYCQRTMEKQPTNKRRSHANIPKWQSL